MKKINNPKKIFLSYPCLRGNESKYVNDCLDSEWISTSGSYIAKFEESVADYVRTNSAVACVNGTAALHICLILAGVQPEEEVIVPTLTFIAPINTVKYVFAEPLFMDCDDYLNIDVDKLEKFLKEECFFNNNKVINKKTGKRIRVIMPVHVFGSICNMDKLMALAEQYNLTVIEDATEALGSKITSGKYKGMFAGTIGDFGCFSFNGNKIITCGGGGMLVAKDLKISKKAKYLTTQAKDDGLHYIHNEIGYNYRLTAISAALGLAQMEQLPNFVKTKQKNYLKYKNVINNILGLKILDIPDYSESNCWFYSLFIDEKVYALNRDQLMQKFEEANIQTRPIWRLNHEQKPYVNCRAYEVKKAQYYFDHILNIPCSVGLIDGEFDRIIKVLKSN